MSDDENEAGASSAAAAGDAPEGSEADAPGVGEAGTTRAAEQHVRVGLGTARSAHEPSWTRLLAPFRSEDAAFRALLAVAAVCGTLAVVLLLVRALS